LCVDKSEGVASLVARQEFTLCFDTFLMECVRSFHVAHLHNLTESGTRSMLHRRPECGNQLCCWNPRLPFSFLLQEVMVVGVMLCLLNRVTAIPTRCGEWSSDCMSCIVPRNRPLCGMGGTLYNSFIPPSKSPSSTVGRFLSK